MAIQKVNTEAVAAAAAAITSANNHINAAFDAVRSAGSDLQTQWNSRAGSAAQDLIYRLFKGNDSRSAILQNYANTLQQVVTPGYVQSETTNAKLADLFQ